MATKQTKTKKPTKKVAPKKPTKKAKTTIKIGNLKIEKKTLTKLADSAKFFADQVKKNGFEKVSEKFSIGSGRAFRNNKPVCIFGNTLHRAGVKAPDAVANDHALIQGLGLDDADGWTHLDTELERICEKISVNNDFLVELKDKERESTLVSALNDFSKAIVKLDKHVVVEYDDEDDGHVTDLF